MKIALVNDVVYRYASRNPAAVGGSERYQWNLVRALAAHGWSAVVGVQSALKGGERARIEGVEFVGIGPGQFLGALYAFFASERPDWCFWYGSTHLLGPAVMIGRLTGTRSLFAAQFDLDVRPREALTECRPFWPLYALGLSGSNKIFLQHGGQYAELPSRWGSKTHVIPGVVSVPDSFTSHADRDPYVAWVGVLRQPKRPDLLIDLARRCPSLKFVVCGGTSAHRSPPGYGERIIAELARVPNIEYRGHISPDAAIDVIGHAAVLLSTSDAEGYPSVFVEAWAHGTPVVSLTIDPDRVIARHGLGVMCDGVETAARDLQAMVESPENREAIAIRTRKYVALTHSGAAVAAMVERAITTALAPALQPFESRGTP